MYAGVKLSKVGRVEDVKGECSPSTVLPITLHFLGDKDVARFIGLSLLECD